MPIYPEAICEIGRILKDGGYFIFSTPSKEWADSLRSEGHNKTTFISDIGESIEVFSFIHSEKYIINLLHMCGFDMVTLTSYKGKSLQGKEISEAISKASENTKKDYQELDIITTGIFHKRGVFSYG